GRSDAGKRARPPRSELRSDAIHADWPHDILEALLAEILEDAIEPVPHLVVHDRRHTDPAGLGHALQPRRDVDAVAVDVAVLDNDVARIDPDAEFDAPVLRDRVVALGHPALHRDGAGDRLDD